jgi:hypothetical protein
MMDRMGAPPIIVGRQRQHAERASDPIIGETVLEEGPMAAIVLDHEQPRQQARGRHCQQQAEPIIEMQRCPHQQPEQRQRTGRDRKLDLAAQRIRCAIARENLHPVAGIERERGRDGALLLVQCRLDVAEPGDNWCERMSGRSAG